MDWLGDYNNSGARIQQAVWLDDLPVGVYADKLYTIEPDHLGTPRAIIDPTRDVVVWRWDLNGEAFGATQPNQNPDLDGTNFVFNLRYPGQRYDSATGLNYNYFRDYEAATGRYVQSDPIGLGSDIATYAYVRSSPLHGYDPLGLFEVDKTPPQFWAYICAYYGDCVPEYHPDIDTPYVKCLIKCRGKTTLPCTTLAIGVGLLTGAFGSAASSETSGAPGLVVGAWGFRVTNFACNQFYASPYCKKQCSSPDCK